ncbi:hypothetical protein pb186bvf_006586 [Paramecium bursaria]
METITSNQITLKEEQNRSGRSLRSTKVVDIAFKNIKYSVPSNIDTKVQRTILNDITGICPGGQITAILGSSGAGKTSLLNVLACRIAKSPTVSLSGQLTANKVQYDYDIFTNFASYVMQNDVLLETMTPREAFTFVANFKYADPEIKQRRIEETIKSMKLEKCQNSFIGGVSKKGISGGEKKRTSIGFELVSNPSCILLDEPTSGLDSFTAFYIINQLKLLAKDQDRTIIFTIHQPSSDIFMMFDRIMLLVQGKLIYQGSRDNIIDYFSSIGFKCPHQSNPMDYFMSIMHSDDDRNIKNYQIYFDNYESIIQPRVNQEIEDQNTGELTYKQVETSTLYQIQNIAQREWLDFKRNEMQMKQRLLQAIFQGLIFGGIFWGVGDTNGDYAGVFSLSGALFFVALNAVFLAVLQYILSFTIERDVFIREENSKLYTTLSYFLGKQLIDIPFCIICPVIENLILYWMMDLNSDSAEIVLIHMFITVILFLCCNSLGLMTGCVFKTTQLALDASDMILMPAVIFSGFIANSKQFYVWIGWIQWISPLKYAFEAIMINQTSNRNYEVQPEELFDFTLGIWPCIAILLGLFVLFRVIAVIFLYKLRTRQQ